MVNLPVILISLVSWMATSVKVLSNFLHRLGRLHTWRQVGLQRPGMVNLPVILISLVSWMATSVKILSNFLHFANAAVEGLVFCRRCCDCIVVLLAAKTSTRRLQNNTNTVG